MKKLSTLSLLALILFFSCKDEEKFSPTNPTINESEGWARQMITIHFDNPDIARFAVKFGDLTVKTNSPSSDGLAVAIPAEVIEDQSLRITMETPKGTIVLKESFLIRARPSIQYASSTSFSYRIPLKVIVKNKDYFTNINSAYFCSPGTTSTNKCERATLTFSGDTLIFKASMAAADYNLTLAGSYAFTGDYNDPNPSTLSEVQMPTSFVFSYRPSYRQMTSSGKAGDKFNMVLNDSNYFPDDVIVTFKSSAGTETTVINKGWDIVGAAGYINATFGAFEIPALAAGAYTISVKDPKGVVFLPEIKNVFTITN